MQLHIALMRARDPPSHSTRADAIVKDRAQMNRPTKDRGITTLILAGVSTSGVVLSTVREAADRDYRIYVLADASADRDPHVHAVLTEKVLPMQAHLITVADLPGLIVSA